MTWAMAISSGEKTSCRLFLIFLILYFQFRSVITTSLVFSGIAIACAGGFLMLWLYAQPWFLNVNTFEVNLQELFQIGPINLSIAAWVGFLALVGILALLPVLTSTGRGADLMVPMAIPSVGGMVIAIMTMLVVPVLYCTVQEWKLRLGIRDPRFAQHAGG